MICLAHKYKSLYLCIVFFMVLDLRLSKDWVVVMTTFLFFIYFCLYHPFVLILLQRYAKLSGAQMKNTFFQNGNKMAQL